MKIIIVDNQTLSVLHKYEASAPSHAIFGGPWGSDIMTTHVICSPLLDADCVKAVRDSNGIILIQEDQALVAEKTKALWVELRNTRTRKLSECDWTQMPDAQLNVQDKAAWAVYRQELRDLPEVTEDPREVVWPTTPNVQI